MGARKLQWLVLGPLMLAVGACGDSSEMGQVSLQLATRRTPLMTAVAPSVMGAPGQLVVTLGSDEIVIDQVGIVLRKIRLDGAPTASCPEDAEGDSQCAGIWLGPVVYDLPLGVGAEQTVTAPMPVGTYARIKFQIHKPSNANGDADLVADHPEFANTSIRVTGTHNGSPFTFATDLTEVEDVRFPEPVEVVAGVAVGVTLHVDVSGWFANAGGNGLVDPSQANDGGPFESLVEQQIRASFRAFRDGDLDGAAD
jgi:hypothetical protein